MQITTTNVALPLLFNTCLVVFSCAIFFALLQFFVGKSVSFIIIHVVITRLISDQIALHSLQLPLLITLFLTNQIAGNTIDFKTNVIKRETTAVAMAGQNVCTLVIQPNVYIKVHTA